MTITHVEEIKIFKDRLRDGQGNLSLEKLVEYMYWKEANFHLPTPRFGWSPTE